MKEQNSSDRGNCLKESKKFEENVRDFLSKKWKVKLENRKIKIGKVNKNFDLVSEDFSYIGDAKYYKNIKVPAAKWSTIAEYVWLLEKTNAKNKFLVFGKDIDVPKRWLNRFENLTKIKFYFFDGKRLIILNKRKDVEDE